MQTPANNGNSLKTLRLRKMPRNPITTPKVKNMQPSVNRACVVLKKS